MTTYQQLTSRARQRLAFLEDRASAATVLTHNAISRERDLNRSLGERPEGDPDDSRRDELAAVEARRQAAQAEASAAEQLLARCRSWLDKVPPHLTLGDIEFPSARLKRGETHDDVVWRIRDQITKLQAERARVEAAPLPRAHQEAEIRAAVGDLAERGKLTLGFDRKTGRATIDYTIPSAFAVGAQHSLVLAALVDPNGLADHLIGRLPEAGDGAMAPSTRLLKLGEIDEKIEDLALVEEAHIDAGGGTVPRRADCDPRVVLGLRIGKLPKLPKLPARAEEAEAA